MAWYRFGLWKKRAAITVDLAATGATVDVDVVIPREWDEFWEAIDASGNELRAVWYDGQTTLSYDVDNGSGGAFDKTNRLGRIRIDGMTVPNVTAMLQIWVYFDSTSTQGDGSVAVTITSARNGYIEISRPRSRAFSHHPQTPGLSRPRFTITKALNEQIHVWFDYGRAVGRRPTPGNKGPIHEELWYADQAVENTGGSDQTSMYTLTEARFVYHQGRMWLRLTVKGGAANTNYTIVAKVRTIQPGATALSQQLESRLGLAVRDTRITT